MPVSAYTQSYNSFSGVDIVATFGGVLIGELQGVSYSVTREKAPIYTMGSADPRSFSRGKRGIAGTLVFTVFNRSALLETFRSAQIGTNGEFFAHVTDVARHPVASQVPADQNVRLEPDAEARRARDRTHGELQGRFVGNQGPARGGPEEA